MISGRVGERECENEVGDVEKMNGAGNEDKKNGIEGSNDNEKRSKKNDEGGDGKNMGDKKMAGHKNGEWT